MLTINNTLDEYLKDVEIKGNTIQDTSNLADIRSVGDKVEGQELYEIPVLSTNKNIFSSTLEVGDISDTNGIYQTYDASVVRSKEFIKVKPNTTYCFSVVLSDTSSFDTLYEYGRDKKFIKKVVKNNGMFTTSENAGYISFKIQNRLNIDAKVQIEEGTQATPYEPYVEDKLTILSPVQLERVGDVRDRIICKDGVWGVEKNIETKYLKDMPMRDNIEEATHYRLGNYSDTFPMRCDTILCNNYMVATSASTESTQTQIMAFKHSNTRIEIRLAIQKSDVPDITTINELVSRVKNGDTYIKYQLVEPQFIPLPHSQQVKLRTFASKTNISFLTEIEGTIKAQVPKSLGATVNTHTEQINNLNKELDRVKKLEESTVSTVTTEIDFTTVEATSNGYFEDVKLDGKTLVNLSGSVNDYFNQFDVVSRTCMLLKCNTEYTAVISNKADHTVRIYGNEGSMVATPTYDIPAKTTIIKKLRTKDVVDDTGLFKSNSATGTLFNLEVILLEGDHTQNPPSFFEGLKSVGQSATTSEDGVDEIVVSSVNKNLFSGNILLGRYDETGNFINDNRMYTTSKFKIQANKTIVVNHNDINTIWINFWDVNMNHISQVQVHPYNSITTPINCVICSITGSIGATLNNLQVEYGSIATPYTPHQADKKRLLYYNNETQVWEKPVLREWDSIEKHSDGKYYYHQRSGEKVLNGNEDGIVLLGDNTTSTLGFGINKSNFPNIKKISVYPNENKVFNDKFNYLGGTLWNVDSVGIALNGDDDSRMFQVKLLKTSLNTQDVAGFKKWLQANNVTVVYQLAQEKVYECTNIDLITYANETNYIVESGAIAPKTTLKVHNNISNVVSLLQKKVSLLESNVTRYMITQNRLMLASRYNADNVTFKVDYSVCNEYRSQENYDADLYNLILNNILVGKDNYDYDHMLNIIMDYASWSQISWDQFDILVGMMDLQHNPPIELPTEGFPEETPEE